MTLGRVCNACGRFYVPAGRSRGRCPECTREYWREASARRRATRGTTSQRGYGTEHQRLARVAIAAHPYCTMCGSTRDLVADHVIPLSRGGTSTPDNLQVLCRTCNTRKHNQFFSSADLTRQPENGEKDAGSTKYLPGVG